MKYEKALWCSTMGMPFRGAASFSQRAIAACQRSRNNLAREWYVAALPGSSCARRSSSTAATFAILRGSVWMCGLPPGWMSPSARSTTFGTSSLATYCEASRYPGVPSWILLLPLCVSSSGSQPISSSDPEHTSRSAVRMRAIRLGRASMRCGSCRAVVAEYTKTLSAPSSWARAAHSGSQVKTLSAAAAGNAASARTDAAASFRIDFMFAPLELVGAVSAQADDVLEEDLVVGRVRARLVLRELQPDAAELTRAPVHHDRAACRVVLGEDREIRGSERARIDEADAGRAGAQAVVPVADSPHRDELVHALEVPA